MSPSYVNWVNKGLIMLAHPSRSITMSKSKVSDISSKPSWSALARWVVWYPSKSANRYKISDTIAHSSHLWTCLVARSALFSSLGGMLDSTCVASSYIELMSVSAVDTVSSTAFSPLFALTAPRSVLTLLLPFVLREVLLKKYVSEFCSQSPTYSLDIHKLPVFNNSKQIGFIISPVMWHLEWE